MKKWLWMFIAALAAGCSDDDKPTGGGKGEREGALSTLTEDVALDQLTVAALEYTSGSETQDSYILTLSTNDGVSPQSGTGAFVRFRLAVGKDTPPFGRYAVGTETGEQVVTGNEDASWYYALDNGQVVAKAPLCSGQLTLSKIPGKKPADTRYYISFSAADDAQAPHTVSGSYSGLLACKEKPGEALPETTYVLAGVSGYTQEYEYTTWGIDFDSADFTKHLAIFTLNAGPGITEEEGIPAGVYTIAENDAPFTATWTTYNDTSQDISMEDLVEGTITFEREGDKYKVAVDAKDDYNAVFKADFEGRFHYENTTDERTFDAREVYAVYYGAVSAGTGWYITLADRGYLSTGDAAGNYYYGSILHLDLVAEGAADFSDGLPEGTFQVLSNRSGTGIYGGTGSDCTSFLTEYFSGIPTVCKLTGGSVRITRSGEQATIRLEGVKMSGDITSLDGTYTGKVQYIDGREQ